MKKCYFPYSCVSTMMPSRAVLGGGSSNNKVKYSRLAADEDGYIDLQVRNSN